VKPSRVTALFVDADTRPETTKSLRLQGAIRDAIRLGQLEPGDQLPSTRHLATELGWARNVIVGSFDQLVAEGYLKSKIGSGTTVTNQRTHTTSAQPLVQVTARPNLQFEPGEPDLVGFPVREWGRSVREALTMIPSAELGYANPTGSPTLKSALARYLNRARATDIQPEQILITTGVSASLRLVVAALSRERQICVAVEDPGPYNQRNALAAANAQLAPVRVDEYGLAINELEQSKATIVVVSPAHQYPLGYTLGPERRNALIQWARAVPGRLIIEDDYDAEFRYDRKPVGAIQGMAPDVTATTGSLSKTMAPGLRLGWIALPQHLIEQVGRQLAAEFGTPDVIQQHALAQLIATGRYDRIIARRRTKYREQRQRMTTQISLIPGCEVIGNPCGLHITVKLPDAINDKKLSATLALNGIHVPPLSRYRTKPGFPGLVISFANSNPTAIARLQTALKTELTT
jgi:GntR family transcriptional regulator / MocR family aminotransferase